MEVSEFQKLQKQYTTERVCQAQELIELDYKTSHGKLFPKDFFRKDSFDGDLPVIPQDASNLMALCSDNYSVTFQSNL